MKSFRKNPSFGRPSYSDKKGSLFAVLPIIPNAIAVAVFIAAYYYVFVQREMYPDYAYYVYWAVKLLVGYNILAASARSIFAPLIALAFGAAGLYVSIAKVIPSWLAFMMNLPATDAWQIIGAGAVGLLITLLTKF